MKKKWFKIGITNFVTFLRMIGIVALIPVYKIFGGATTAVLSASCFATDWIDGQMARKFDASTFFGSLFDGVSDKLFLIANMVLLLGITPLAIIPILLEVGIAGIQTLKYKNNLNVKSNFIGKAKMWLAGITVTLSYLLVDPNVINYFSADLVTKIASMDQIKLFGAVLSPMILSEVATLTSYINEFRKEKKEYEAHEEERRLEQAKTKEELKKDIDTKSVSEILFDPEFYKKYKDNSHLMDMTHEVLTRKRVRKKDCE